MPASCSCLYRAEREFWGVLGASQLKSCQPPTARKAVMVSWEPVPCQGRCFPNPWVLRFPQGSASCQTEGESSQSLQEMGRKAGKPMAFGAVGDFKPHSGQVWRSQVSPRREQS